MNIVIKECNSIGQGFLKDLGNYESIDKWMTDIINKKSNFYPMDLAVRFNGEAFRIIEVGIVVENAQKIIDEIKKLPFDIRKMPNDNLEIEADIFESELYIEMK